MVSAAETTGTLNSGWDRHLGLFVGLRDPSRDKTNCARRSLKDRPEDPGSIPGSSTEEDPPRCSGGLLILCLRSDLKRRRVGDLATRRLTFGVEREGQEGLIGDVESCRDIDGGCWRESETWVVVGVAEHHNQVLVSVQYNVSSFSEIANPLPSEF